MNIIKEFPNVINYKFLVEEPANKKRKNLKNQTEEIRYYGAELVVYDKHQRCLLTEGEYQLVLQEVGQKASPKKLSSWESFPEGKEKVFEIILFIVPFLSCVNECI